MDVKRQEHIGGGRDREMVEFWIQRHSATRNGTEWDRQIGTEEDKQEEGQEKESDGRAEEGTRLGKLSKWVAGWHVRSELVWLCVRTGGDGERDDRRAEEGTRLRELCECLAGCVCVACKEWTGL
ncbi:hypothetical protein Pmani_022055 [Petrolisthes manimaculis]|uniref:Uncharacterized protein n=1 Tax=Petrolisthes manimaculis TaxID=1843537 RepID=A0AAE1PCJ3_9EUCA|nr:hypothetical protein Pmani_022055 [Petrolisthes manimaculis]